MELALYRVYVLPWLISTKLLTSSPDTLEIKSGRNGVIEQMSSYLFWECEWWERVQILSLSALLMGGWWLLMTLQRLLLPFCMGVGSTYTLLSPSPHWSCTCSTAHLLGPLILQAWRATFTQPSPCYSVFVQYPFLSEVCGPPYLSRPHVTLCHTGLIFSWHKVPLDIFVFLLTPSRI